MQSENTEEEESTIKSPMEDYDCDPLYEYNEATRSERVKAGMEESIMLKKQEALELELDLS